MKTEKLLKALMGEPTYEALTKALEKIPTKSVVDLQELHASLKVVPKALISFLIKELKPLAIHEAKEIKLPFEDNAYLLVNKQANDVYLGHIREGGKIIHEFKLTAIPQLAAHIMSTFELYEDSQIEPEKGESTKVLEEGKDRPKADTPAVAELQHKVDDLQQKLNDTQMQMLNDKVDDLMSIVAQNTEKSELEKAGQMPTMPGPPKAGSTGGVQGTKTGIMGTKTAETDKQLKTPKMKLPNLKPPKNSFVKSLKMSLSKSQSSTCPDCGQAEIQSGTPVQCACFKALSKPLIKAEGTVISMSFKDDWDQESIETLYKSLMSRSNGRK